MKKIIYYVVTILQVVCGIMMWSIENIWMSHMTFNRWVLYKSSKLLPIPYTLIIIKGLLVLGIILIAFGVISWFRNEGNRFDSFLLILLSILFIYYAAANNIIEAGTYYLYCLILVVIMLLQAIKVFLKQKRNRL